MADTNVHPSPLASCSCGRTSYWCCCVPGVVSVVAAPTQAEIDAHLAAGRTDAELAAAGYVPLVICGERRGWTLQR